MTFFFVTRCAGNKALFFGLILLPGSSISSSSRRKRKASPETVYKTIILVNCFDGEQLNEGGGVPVDLLKLERQDVNFSIILIQEEILYQLRMSMPSIKTTGFVLLNKKGNPLNIMPNTQGLFLFVTKPLSKGYNWKKSWSLVSRIFLNILKTLKIQLENLEEIFQNPKNLDNFIYSFIFELYALWPLSFEYWNL